MFKFFTFTFLAILSISASAQVTFQSKPIVIHTTDAWTFMNNDVVLEKDGSCRQVKSSGQLDRNQQQKAETYNDELHHLPLETCKILTARSKAALQFKRLGMICNSVIEYNSKAHTDRDCKCVSLKVGTFLKGETSYSHSIKDCLSEFPESNRDELLEIEKGLAN